MAPNKLLYEGGTVYAQPSFRVIALIDMPLSAAPMRQAMQTILDHFLEAASERLTVFAYSGGKVKSLKPEVFSPKIVAKARKLIAEEGWAWPTTLRFNAYFEDPHPCVAPPHLRLEQRAQMGLFQIELPPEDAMLADFADLMSSALADLPVIWGVMGFGMYQPVSLESLIWMLPRVTPRYRCSIEVQPNFVEDGLRRIEEYAFYQKFPQIIGGIGDVGWRTMIGNEFLSRLPPLNDLASQPDLAVGQFAQFAQLTAGPEPIWGDINSGEDVSTWQNAAKALAPVRPDWEFAKRRMFGGGYENDNGLDRIEAWHNRFGS